MDIAAIALSGLEASAQSFDTAARKVASAGESADVVDLSAAVVSMMSAQNAFRANAQAVHVADQMQKSAVDLIG
jgi:flagellar hook protein FlgE